MKTENTAAVIVFVKLCCIYSLLRFTQSHRDGKVLANSEVVIDDTEDDIEKMTHSMNDADADGTLGKLTVARLVSLQRGK